VHPFELKNKMPAKPKRKAHAPAQKVGKVGEAPHAIGSNDVIQLTERECLEFISAILSPPEPSVSLKAAAKRYFDREIRQL